MNNIAILAFTNPFTKFSDGGKKDIETRIKALCLKNYYIDIYTLNKSNEILKEININNVKLICDTRKNKLKDIFSFYPISVINKYSMNIKEELIKNINKYDLIIYEGEHMIKYRYDKDIKCKLNYIRMHDIESIYRYELFKSTFPKIKSYFQLLESIKYKFIEKNIINYFDRFLFISKKEKEIFENFFPAQKQKFIWMPPVIESNNENIIANNDLANNILYFGDLSVAYNMEGLKWFIFNVYPIIRKSNLDVKINIIGKISYRDKVLLEKFDKNINILGYVHNIDEYIKNAKFVLIPILHGAGVKIKLIESLSKGKIVVATSKACEGTDFENDKHVLIRDNPKEFAETCIDIIRNYKNYKILGENAFKHTRKNYSLNYQSNLLEELITIDLKRKSRCE
jgi:glycosyltransferase involved in cell wall biosynthesis